MADNLTGFYVYIYFDPDTGAPFYVGKGSKYRSRKHLHQTHSRPLRMKLQALKAAGLAPRIEQFSCPTEEQAFEFEADMIASFGRRVDGSGSLFNLSEGGQRTVGFSGRHHTEEAKERIRRAMRARRLTPEHKEKIRQAGLKRDVSHLHSVESKDKLRAVQQSDAYRCQMSDSMKKSTSSAHLAEMTSRAAMATRGKRQTPEHVAKRAASAKEKRLARSSNS